MRKLIEIAARIEPVQDGRIHIELINVSFLVQLGGKGSELEVGMTYAAGCGLACA